jgi:predicted Ser/Thr protein kinase
MGLGTSAREPGLVGQYRLLQRLGEGGMGVVHLALDPEGRAVAVKVLRPHVAADPDARRRLAREVATLRRVRHPRVAAVIDADVEGDVPYLVTHFVPGKPLDAHIRDHGPLPRGHVARIGSVLAEALRAIHAAGVVHRDVKPANVMLLDGDPILIDFGIAHVADESRITHTGLVMGTPGYLSPEIIGGDQVTEATDWWGWGATLAFAATGRPPFGTGPIEVVLDRVRRGAPDIQGIDEGLGETLRSALSVDPGQRPHPDRLVAGLAAVSPKRSGTPPRADGVSRAPAPPASAAAAAPAAAGPVPGAAVPGAAAVAAAAVAGPPAGASRMSDPDAATSVTPPPGRRTDPAAVTPPGSDNDPYAATTVTAPPGRDSDPDAATTVTPPPNGIRRSGADGVTSAVPPPATTRRFDAPSSTRPPDGQYQPYPPPPPAPANGFGRPGPAGPRPPVTGPAYGEAGPATAAPPDEAPAKPPVDPATGVIVGVVVVLAGVAAVAPYGATWLAALGILTARVVDRTRTSLLQRRDQRGGASGSDQVLTVAALPWRILVEGVKTWFFLILPILVGVSIAFIVATAQAGAPAQAIPGDPVPLAGGMFALLLTAWFGPGGGPVRRGTRRVIRSAVPSRRAQIVTWSVIALVLISVLSVLNAQAGPDWGPLEQSPIVNNLTSQ